MEKKIVCQSCAAEFSDALPECPYCGTMNYKGAESVYLGKLENVRKDMEGLNLVPIKEQKKEFNKLIFLWMKVLLVLACAAGILAAAFYWQDYKVKKQDREEIAWLNENAPLLDKLYAEENFDELQKRYLHYIEKEYPVWRWRHNYFMSIYCSIVSVRELQALERASEYGLAESDYLSMFYDQWKIKGIDFSAGFLDKEEIEKLKKLSEDIPLDIKAQWGMSDEEYERYSGMLEENRGYIIYDDCAEYVRSWYAKEKKGSGT